MITNLYWYSC